MLETVDVAAGLRVRTEIRAGTDFRNRPNTALLVVAGAQTDACVRATLHGAFVRGYDTLLVADAHTTEDFTEYGLPPADKIIAHTNMYWTWQSGPGRTATVVEAADVDFQAVEASSS